MTTTKKMGGRGWIKSMTPFRKKHAQKMLRKHIGNFFDNDNNGKNTKLEEKIEEIDQKIAGKEPGKENEKVALLEQKIEEIDAKFNDYVTINGNDAFMRSFETRIQNLERTQSKTKDMDNTSSSDNNSAEKKVSDEETYTDSAWEKCEVIKKQLITQCKTILEKRISTSEQKKLYMEFIELYIRNQSPKGCGFISPSTFVPPPPGANDLDNSHISYITKAFNILNGQESSPGESSPGESSPGILIQMDTGGKGTTKKRGNMYKTTQRRRHKRLKTNKKKRVPKRKKTHKK